jgi:hypothetical protein
MKEETVEKGKVTLSARNIENIIFVLGVKFHFCPAVAFEIGRIAGCSVVQLVLRLRNH